MKRRTLLRNVGTVGTIGIAGCSQSTEKTTHSTTTHAPNDIVASYRFDGADLVVKSVPGNAPHHYSLLDSRGNRVLKSDGVPSSGTVTLGPVFTIESGYPEGNLTLIAQDVSGTSLEKHEIPMNPELSYDVSYRENGNLDFTFKNEGNGPASVVAIALANLPFEDPNDSISPNLTKGELRKSTFQQLSDYERNREFIPNKLWTLNTPISGKQVAKSTMRFSGFVIPPNTTKVAETIPILESESSSGPLSIGLQNCGGKDTDSIMFDTVIQTLDYELAHKKYEVRFSTSSKDECDIVIRGI